MNTFIEKYKVKDLTICDELIKYFKDNKEYKGEGRAGNGVYKHIKESIDVIFYNNSKNKNIIKFFNILVIFVQKYMEKYNLQHNLKTYIANNIQYYKPGAAYFDLHYERNLNYPNRQLVYMMYLNTIKDNGGTEFPYQNITLSAIKGDLYIWPADFTHPHKGIVSPTQEKYIVTGWFELVK
jgi:prolyl 4-hydroxylase